jgi:Domain of unknown function (DUF4926)
MIEEFKQVALTVDLPAFGFEAGDVATVVDITPNGEQVTLEFFDFMGQTIDVVPVKIDQVRPLEDGEVIHTRAVKTA